MSTMSSGPQGSEGEETTERTEQRGTRCYSSYNSGSQLSFDPMKDLNLPKNYEEVLDRFKRLQGSRAMEALN
ncbi:MAG: hypothetical protein R2815_02945 [Flavobacteriales bacterium]|nr:hypothetical protein [Flavobacteriales bacterium]